MSYNVRYDSPGDRRYRWVDRRDAVASTIRFHDPDVIGLQEALHAQLRDIRDRLDGYEWLAAGRPEEGSAGEFTAIAYRRDRLAVRAVQRPLRPQWRTGPPGECGAPATTDRRADGRTADGRHWRLQQQGE